MEGLNLAPILIPIGALLFGWIIGFFDSNNRTAKKIRAAEARAEAAIKEAEDRKAEADARLAFVSASPEAVDDPGLLRLKSENGGLSLELDGVRVDTSALSSSEKKRLIDLLTLMRPWLEGKTVQQSVPRPAAPQPASVTPARSGPPVVTAAIKPEEETPPFTTLSMIGQIDSILQGRLVNSPLAGRGIRLQESPGGGVEVVVGANKFPTIDDVPDPDVKSIIRAAVAEWERKFTPGL